MHARVEKNTRIVNKIQTMGLRVLSLVKDSRRIYDIEDLLKVRNKLV